MALRTALTEQLGIEHPIVLAPMGGVSGGALAAAVSNGGGLGMVGAGSGARQWLEPELQNLTGATDKPWGVGFLSWALEKDALAWVLEQRPHAVMLSFGDPSPYAEMVLKAGIALLIQVTDLEEAARAVDVGATFVVAQGSEAGGHGGGRATLPFVPAVIDAVGPTSVLVAGGIADGRGVAAALALGGAGAVIGTRFEACDESLISSGLREVLLDRKGSDTERTHLLDVARGSQWPSRYSARVVTNPFLDQWRGRELELLQDAEALSTYKAAAKRNDPAAVSIWAGECLDLIHEIRGAEGLVGELAADAEEQLRRALDVTA
jgi:nitronate monooxygenase